MWLLWGYTGVPGLVQRGAGAYAGAEAVKAISLFSGVGGFDLGFERAGIETVLQAEIDPWCNKVLARHWPNTRRVTDVRCVGSFRESTRRTQADGHLATVDDGRRETGAGLPDGVDLVYGGFPCQDVSVAGKRAGLGGERSGLWFEFHRILSELRPRWALIENVPGLLSSNDGRDFAVILDGLGELGFHVAWAVLDAQHFGVPQRRRRVFVVAGPTRRSVEQVLSVCESCGGNPETGRTQGEGTAYSLTAGVRGTGDGHGNAWNSNYVTALQDVRGQRDKKQNGIGIAAGEPMYTLDGTSQHGVFVETAAPLGSNATGGFRFDLDHDTYIPDIVGQAISAKWAKGSSGPSGDEIQNMVGVAQGVRRLTPLECERLMGWPDDWTRWDAEGNEIPDSHRYRMAGNGVASPVAEWIGWRLMAV